MLNSNVVPMSRCFLGVSGVVLWLLSNMVLLDVAAPDGCCCFYGSPECGPVLCEVNHKVLG